METLCLVNPILCITAVRSNHPSETPIALRRSNVSINVNHQKVRIVQEQRKLRSPSEIRNCLLGIRFNNVNPRNPSPVKHTAARLGRER